MRLRASTRLRISEFFNFGTEEVMLWRYLLRLVTRSTSLIRRAVYKIQDIRPASILCRHIVVSLSCLCHGLKGHKGLGSLFESCLKMNFSLLWSPSLHLSLNLFLCVICLWGKLHWCMLMLDLLFYSKKSKLEMLKYLFCSAMKVEYKKNWCQCLKKNHVFSSSPPSPPGLLLPGCWPPTVPPPLGPLSSPMRS